MKIRENLEDHLFCENWTLNSWLNEGACFQQDYWETEFTKLSKASKNLQFFAESNYSASARK